MSSSLSDDDDENSGQISFVSNFFCFVLTQSTEAIPRELENPDAQICSYTFFRSSLGCFQSDFKGKSKTNSCNKKYSHTGIGTFHSPQDHLRVF